MMRWYVLQVKGGKEQQVVEQLRKIGIHALAPVENRLIHSKSQWKNKSYILFTNYVFIEAHFDADTWYKVSGIPDVVKWLGDKKDPTPIAYMEAEWIRLLGNEGNALQPSTVEIMPDGTYKIHDGILTLLKHNIKQWNKRQCNCEVYNPIASIENETFKLSVTYIDTSKGKVVDSSCETELIDTKNNPI